MTKNYLTSVQEWHELSRRANYHSQTLAKLCGLSTRQLRRLCHQLFGRSTQEWLDEQRLIAARDLLQRMPLVKAVAFELGYKQISHFSRQFKERYGMTASEFIQRTECGAVNSVPAHWPMSARDNTSGLSGFS